MATGIPRRCQAFRYYGKLLVAIIELRLATLLPCIRKDLSFRWKDHSLVSYPPRHVETQLAKEDHSDRCAVSSILTNGYSGNPCSPLSVRPEARDKHQAISFHLINNNLPFQVRWHNSVEFESCLWAASCLSFKRTHSISDVDLQGVTSQMPWLYSIVLIVF